MAETGTNFDSSGKFRLGDWVVEPSLNRLCRHGQQITIENKAMDVLVLLASRAGEVVSNDDMIESVWDGRPMGDNPVYKAVNSLRKALGDDPKEPTYIATIAGRGYRLIAPISSAEKAAGGRNRRWLGLAALLVVGALFIIGLQRLQEPASDAAIADKSIAVLPFENLSVDEDIDYLCRGVAEAVLNRLAGHRDLRVLARSSSFEVGGFELENVVRQLGVTHVLKGSVQQSNDTLRITATLLDQSGRVVWSREFDRDNDNLLAVQSEIAAAVARGLRLAVDDRLASRPAATANAEAYKAWLLGNEYTSRRPPGWPRLAMQAFEEAIRLDPQFAEPWAGVAKVHAIIGMNEPERFASANEALQRALELDPQLAEAHAVAGLLKTRDNSVAGYEASLEPLRTALDLNPALIDARNWLSISLMVLGRTRESLQVLDEAMKLDPLNSTLIMNYGRRLHADGQLDAAKAVMVKALELPTTQAYAWGWIAQIEEDRGNLREALEWVKRGARIGFEAPEDARWVGGMLARRYADLGMFERANAWLATVDLSEDSHWWLGAQYEVLGPQGRHEDLAAIGERHRSGEAAALSTWSRWMLARIALENGNYEEAIGLFEAVFVDDWSMYNGPGGGPTLFAVAQDFAQALYATGQGDRADDLLREIYDAQLALRAGRTTIIPGYLADEAVTLMLLGDTEAAVARLKEAVESGWRAYYHAMNESRFQPFRDNAAAIALFGEMARDIEIQREQVLAEERLNPFEPALLVNN